MRVLKAQQALGGPTRFGCVQLYTAQQVDCMKVVHAADIIGKPNANTCFNYTSSVALFHVCTCRYVLRTCTVFAHALTNAPTLSEVSYFF